MGVFMSTPWFPFYASDFYASTAAWPPDWVGGYIRLLSFAWMNGGIPNDREAINRIAGGLTDTGWNAICVRLTLVDGDRDGDRHGEREQRWVHPRMERERERTDTIRKARQDAAAATNRKRQDGDRTADRHGERTADRGVTTTTTTTTDTNPPIAPPLKGGRRGKRLRDQNRDMNQPQW
jgi:uncharacterized protein YdaU (DUF1376 family)